MSPSPTVWQQGRLRSTTVGVVPTPQHQGIVVWQVVLCGQWMCWDQGWGWSVVRRGTHCPQPTTSSCSASSGGSGKHHVTVTLLCLPPSLWMGKCWILPLLLSSVVCRGHSRKHKLGGLSGSLLRMVKGERFCKSSKTQYDTTTGYRINVLIHGRLWSETPARPNSLTHHFHISVNPLTSTESLLIFTSVNES